MLLKVIQKQNELQQITNTHALLNPKDMYIKSQPKETSIHKVQMA